MIAVYILKKKCGIETSEDQMLVEMVELESQY